MTRVEKIEAAARKLVDFDVVLCDHLMPNATWDEAVNLLDALRDSLDEPCQGQPGDEDEHGTCTKCGAPNGTPCRGATAPEPKPQEEQRGACIYCGRPSGEGFPGCEIVGGTGQRKGDGR